MGSSQAKGWGKKAIGVLGLGVVVAVLGTATLAASQQPSDRAATEAILAELARTKGTEPAASAVLEAKKALERATSMRGAGDVPHAEQAEGLAREWAESARDLMRAVAIEGEASTLQLGAADAGVQSERARALLEESLARRGRAAAELALLPEGGAPAQVSKSKGPDAPAKTKASASPTTGKASASKPAKPGQGEAP